MSNAAVFLGGADVEVAAAGALSGDGAIGDPLQVNVDGVTITVNGSNKLVGSSTTIGDTQVAYADGANTIAGDADFTWTKSTNTLALGSGAGISFVGAGTVMSGVGGKIQMTNGPDFYFPSGVYFDSDGTFTVESASSVVFAPGDNHNVRIAVGGTGVIQLEGAPTNDPTTIVGAGTIWNNGRVVSYADDNTGGPTPTFKSLTLTTSLAVGSSTLLSGASGEFNLSSGSSYIELLDGKFTFSDSVVLVNGKALKTDTTTAHTALFQAYDVDGTAYKTFGTLTNGNTPDFTIAPPSGGTVTLQATTFKSSDGTAGASAGPFTVITGITVKNGLVTTLTGS